MALVIDQDSECGFVYGTLIEFIKCWENGANSRLVLETSNGQAWVNLSCCLGRPYQNHVVPARRTNSRRKQEKDNLRAHNYAQKNVAAKEAVTQTSDDDIDVDVCVQENAKIEDCDEVKMLEDNVELADESGMKEAATTFEDNNCSHGIDISKCTKGCPERVDKYTRMLAEKYNLCKDAKIEYSCNFIS